MYNILFILIIPAQDNSGKGSEVDSNASSFCTKISQRD
jgi:hypothetical protein